MIRRTRRWVVALALAAVLLASAALAFQFTLRRLHGAIESALGPQATLQALTLGWAGVELRGLRLRAQTPAQGRPTGWPAGDELSAERIVVVPALSSLWRDGWRLASVSVEGAQLPLLRSRDGQLRLLPSLLGNPPRSAAKAGAGPLVHIGELRLRDSVIDFHDASVAGARGAPHRIRLEVLRADVGPLALPALDEPATLAVQARIKGPRHSGTLSLRGQLTPATRDADLALAIKGLDLVSVQPYLLRAGEASVKRGTLDLTLAARVKGQRLNAPGRLALSELELGGSDGALASFAGVPRQAVLAALSRDGRIELAFTLDGRLDDPKFSLNELFAARFAVGLADKLGLSIAGAVKDLGSVVKGLFGR